MNRKTNPQAPQDGGRTPDGQAMGPDGELLRVHCTCVGVRRRSAREGMRGFHLPLTSSLPSVLGLARFPFPR